MDRYINPEFRVPSNSHQSLEIHSNKFHSCRPLIENEVFLHNFKCRTTVDSVSSRQRLHSSCRHLLLTLRPNIYFVMWRAERIFFFLFFFENEFERLTRLALSTASCLLIDKMICEPVQQFIFQPKFMKWKYFHCFRFLE